MWRAAVWSAAYLLAFAVFAVVASARSTGNSLMAALTFVECAVIAGAVALFAVYVDPRDRGLGPFLLRMGAVCGLTVLTSSLVLAGAWLLAGAGPIIGGLLAQLVIVAFGFLLASVFAIIRCLGAEPLFAQLVSILVACALMGTVFYANPIIEADWSSGTRSTIIHATLAVNPVTAISSSLLGLDLMRSTRGQLMYDRISVLGGYLRGYPPWWETLCGHVGAALLVLAGAGLSRRRYLSRRAYERGVGR